MRPIVLSYTPLDDDTDYFDSGFTGAGPFTPTTTECSDGMAHLVSLTSGDDLSLITATITGTDADGKAQTEAIVCPNNTTVEGTKYFLTVTGVSVSATLSTNTLDMGVADTAISPTIPLDMTQNPFSVSLAVVISGTINYSLQHCFANILSSEYSQPSTETWFTHSSIATETSNQDGNYAFPVAATRVIVNSLTSGATVEYTIIQGD